MFAIPNGFQSELEPAVDVCSSTCIYVLDYVPESLHVFSSDTFQSTKPVSIAIKSYDAKPVGRCECLQQKLNSFFDKAYFLSAHGPTVVNHAD